MAAAKTVPEPPESFAAFADYATDAIARFDRELRHVYVNPAVVRSTGVPAAMLLGRRPTEVAPETPEAHRWEDTLRQVLRTGEPASGESVVDYPDGRRYSQYRVAPECAADGSICGLVAITRDVTAERETEAALRSSEARYRRLLEQAADGILVCDAHGWIVDANQAICSLLGYAAGELLGVHIGQILDVQDPPAERLALLAAGQTT